MAREKPPALLFEGRRVACEPGDTVAAALLRAGVTTFSRGAKYHRPRGPFCLAGACAQCHMRVDGEPNLPTCVVPARNGLEVSRQNVLGSGDSDLLRAVDFLYRDGIDHHHLMTKFKLMTAATQAVARRLAGIGEVPTAELAVRPARVESHALVVIGAGPAGLAAAAAAARLGVKPCVLEAHAVPGGHVTDGLSDDAMLGAQTIDGLADEVAKAGSLATGTRVVALYGEGPRPLVLARDALGLRQISADRVLLATGGAERPIPFESNDLPGVYGGRGLLRLVRRHGVVPGKRAVVIGSTGDALAVARGLKAAGLGIVAVLDPAGMLERGGEVASGTAPVRALGRNKLKALDVRDVNGKESRLACDVVAATAALQPVFELAAEAGARVEWRPEAGGFGVLLDERGATSVAWLFAAGGVVAEPVPPLASGELAGTAAAASFDPEDPQLQRLRASKARIREGFRNR